MVWRFAGRSAARAHRQAAADGKEVSAGRYSAGDVHVAFAVGSIGPAAIEFYVLVATTPIAIIHLAILLIRERRQKAMLLEADS